MKGKKEKKKEKEKENMNILKTMWNAKKVTQQHDWTHRKTVIVSLTLSKQIP